MSRSRPASNPISFHKHTKQYYVTRGGKRIYLGSDKERAIKKYHRMGLGFEPAQQEPATPVEITIKELANRFIAAQQANWQNPKTTLKCYKDWLGRFIKDHPRLKVANFTVEKFARWKLSLKEREYSPESINHYLSAVRAIFDFAEETDLIEKAPKLRRIKNERIPQTGSKEKPLYTLDELQKLLESADLKLKAIIWLGLNCGFGCTDCAELKWSDLDLVNSRVKLTRGKTGVPRDLPLWPETIQAIENIPKSGKLVFYTSGDKPLIRTT